MLAMRRQQRTLAKRFAAACVRTVAKVGSPARAGPGFVFFNDSQLQAYVMPGLSGKRERLTVTERRRGHPQAPRAWDAAARWVSAAASVWERV